MLEVDHVGFTGSRWGQTPKQKDLFRSFMIARRRESVVAWLHHGDCIGADSEAHRVALELGFKIKIHPPLNVSRRAFNEPYDEMDSQYSFSGRNQRIVLFSKILYATPHEESVGTWNCVDHAVRARIPAIIIYPDGTIERRGE